MYFIELFREIILNLDKCETDKISRERERKESNNKIPKSSDYKMRRHNLQQQDSAYLNSKNEETKLITIHDFMTNDLVS